MDTSELLIKRTGVLMRPELRYRTAIGVKTVTRRLLKEQPPAWALFPQPVIEQRRAKIPNAGQQFVTKGIESWDWTDRNVDSDSLRHWPGYYNPLLCPYGVDGDELYLKESFTLKHMGMPVTHPGGGREVMVQVSYEGFERGIVTLTPEETEKFLKWKKWWEHKSPLFMFRSLARLTMRVGHTRPERILDITEEEAMKEGIVMDPSGTQFTHDGLHGFSTAKEAFLDLWTILHGKDSLDRNDWVWVVPFTVTTNKLSHGGKSNV